MKACATLEVSSCPRRAARSVTPPTPRSAWRRHAAAKALPRVACCTHCVAYAVHDTPAKGPASADSRRGAALAAPWARLQGCGGWSLRIGTCGGRGEAAALTSANTPTHDCSRGRAPCAGLWPTRQATGSRPSSLRSWPRGASLVALAQRGLEGVRRGADARLTTTKHARPSRPLV